MFFLTCTNIVLKSISIIECILSGDSKVYFSIDCIISDDPFGTMNFPVDYLNSITFSGLPPHKLTLNVGAIVMLIGLWIYQCKWCSVVFRHFSPRVYYWVPNWNCTFLLLKTQNLEFSGEVGFVLPGPHLEMNIELMYGVYNSYGNSRLVIITLKFEHDRRLKRYYNFLAKN